MNIDKTTFLNWISDCCPDIGTSNGFISIDGCDGADIKENSLNTENGKIKYTDTKKISTYIRKCLKDFSYTYTKDFDTYIKEQAS